MGVTWLMAVFLAQAVPEARSIAPRDIEDGASGIPAPTMPASVELRSELGKRFRLLEERVSIDGKLVSQRVANRGQELEPRTRLYDGNVPPGWHIVNVVLV